MLVSKLLYLEALRGSGLCCKQIACTEPEVIIYLLSDVILNSG